MNEFYFYKLFFIRIPIIDAYLPTTQRYQNFKFSLKVIYYNINVIRVVKIKYCIIHCVMI